MISLLQYVQDGSSDKYKFKLLGAVNKGMVEKKALQLFRSMKGYGCNYFAEVEDTMKN